MKLAVVLSSLLGVSSTMAIPPALVPEAIVVKEIRQSGNLMPGPGRRRAVRTVLIVEAGTNGCTKADDFDVQVKDEAQTQDITVVRTKPDTCDRPSRRSFDLETGRLRPSSTKAIRVMNPFIVEQHFTH